MGLRRGCCSGKRRGVISPVRFCGNGYEYERCSVLVFIPERAAYKIRGGGMVVLQEAEHVQYMISRRLRTVCYVTLDR